MQNHPLRLDSIQRVTSPRPRDVPARLDELRDMRDGWLEGGGLAPKSNGLDWLSTAFDRYYPDDAPLPYTYPTPEGGISMEWSVENNAGILEIDIDAHSAEWLWFDRDSDDECERTLNMDESADWQWLASEIRSKLTTGAVLHRLPPLRRAGAPGLRRRAGGVMGGCGGDGEGNPPGSTLKEPERDIMDSNRETNGPLREGYGNLS